jgi:asparagine synthase (glutamine-hydrolysing)
LDKDRLAQQNCAGMCGIAGIILDELDPRGAAWIGEMTQRLYHRGPDDGGAVVFGLGGTPVVERRLGRPDEAVAWDHLAVHVGLGARRLAIIDLSPAGRQPMPATGGQVWIVFNGEIYNHEALRDDLRGRGMVFVGRSDTEVFLAAYRAWGRDCFARLEGMWAAAILDWGARRVFLSRDRLGIKPLYLTRFERGIAFASEIKSLLPLPGAARGVNEARLRDFLSQGLVDHTDETLFDGVWSMPPGCWLEIDLRTRTSMESVGAMHRYWRPDCGAAAKEPLALAREPLALARGCIVGGGRAAPPATAEDGCATPQDFADAATSVRETLRQAVRSHLRSDVPVGSCLSGGIDSSAIVTLAHSIVAGGSALWPNWSQHTFTASLAGSPLDETHHADAVVQACPGLRGHTVEPTAERLLADLPTLVRHQEQPFGSPSIYMQWEVMRLARETGVTVLLDGQGGDELFCGYEGYLPPYLAHLLRGGRLPTFLREFRAGRAHFGARALATHVGAHLLPRRLRDALRRGVNVVRPRWLAADLFTVDEPPDMYAALRVTPPEAPPGLHGDGALSRFLWSVLLRDSLPSLLRFEDRNSMAFSIEARVPLLDRALVELAMGLPVEWKLGGGQLKRVLREALRGLVPEAILARRDKIGFTAPTAPWMHGGLSEWWYDLLASKSFRERGCFRPQGVRRLVERFERAAASSAHPARATNSCSPSVCTHLATAIWRLAIVEQWARQFLDG